jgi:hypothetical protein
MDTEIGCMPGECEIKDATRRDEQQHVVKQSEIME